MQHPQHRSLVARLAGAAVIVSTLALAGCAELSWPTTPDYAELIAAAGSCGSSARATSERDASRSGTPADSSRMAACTSAGPGRQPPRR